MALAMNQEAACAPEQAAAHPQAHRLGSSLKQLDGPASGPLLSKQSLEGWQSG